MKVIFLGAPGAGKGTHAAEFSEELGIPHISTGDIFRANIKNGTELGNKTKSYMDQGLLVPDELVVDLVVDRVKQDDCAKGYVLDGFPRTLAQAEALSKITEVDLLLLLEVSRDIIKKRILGRFGCPECGEIYNKYTLQPKVQKEENKWTCDKCGAEIEFKQRSDDTEETLKNRLDAYEKNAKPVIKFYKKKKLLKKVDAENTLDLTEDDIKKIIGL